MVRRGGAGEGGYVTAEAAVVLPVLVGVWAACLLALMAVVGQIRCIDAAREVALATARGEPESVVDAIGDRLLPPGASVAVVVEGRLAVATTALDVRVGGTRLRLPALRATSAALMELDAGR